MSMRIEVKQLYHNYDTMVVQQIYAHCSASTQMEIQFVVVLMT